MIRRKRPSLPLDDKASARLYWELSRRDAFVTGERLPWPYPRLSEEELFGLAFLQARFDPRLMAVLVDFFQRRDHRLHPIRFKEILRKADALAVAAVIGEFVISSEASPETKDLFRFLQTGATPAPTQLFYRIPGRIGGVKMREAIDRPLWAFKKWGFLAADPPLLKENPPARRTYLYDPSSRLHVLEGLAKRKKSFRLREYLEEIRFSVSRQQALKDLKNVPWVRKRGKGKGSYYTL